ncbi:hypothetical protein OE88DRAFT_1661177 [Heliocybe sulcata]|uniref:Uncharacterized protein n=1 Tax=Heliocybe sulcata TaxID=5364 RepID=A0A5C3N003_9AGAM|nr:hypothetical protein OE88DRAFT_1661177 [Heliocybe sulcata]
MDASSSGGPTTASPAPVIVSSTATLILLLSISAAIVFRSLIIRQRHRRLVQQAILDGTYVPGVFPPPPGGRGGLGGRERRELGPKPVMYEANLSKAWTVLPDEAPSYGMDEKASGEWEALMPVSAALVNPPAEDSPPPAPPVSAPVAPVEQRRPLLSRLRSSRRNTPHTVEMTTTNAPPPPYTSQVPGTPAPKSATADPVRMTFLIAMPSPNALRNHSALHRRPLSTATASSFASEKGKEKVHVEMEEVVGEVEVPVLELGVVEMGVEGGRL